MKTLLFAAAIFIVFMIIIVTDTPEQQYTEQSYFSISGNESIIEYYTFNPDGNKYIKQYQVVRCGEWEKELAFIINKDRLSELNLTKENVSYLTYGDILNIEFDCPDRIKDCFVYFTERKYCYKEQLVRTPE